MQFSHQTFPPFHFLQRLPTISFSSYSFSSSSTLHNLSNSSISIFFLQNLLPPVADPALEAAALITFRITQPLEGAILRVLYLAKRVCCQLVGANAPRVLLDLPQFMFAPLSMTNAEQHLWRSGIPDADRLVDDIDFAEFSETRLMPSLSAEVCIPSFSLSFLFSCIFLHMVTLKCDTYIRVRLICRHCILYPLQLGPLFPNDVEILKPKVGFELDQIEN